MTLTGKQVRHLRSMAHHLEPVVLIGKAGVNQTLATQTTAALRAHELIKCGVQDGSDLSAREAADALAEATESEVVQVIGHRFSLYRKSDKPGIEHIELP